MAQHLRRQAEESRALQTKVAQLEAQLRRQSAEFARRTPSPTYPLQASPGRRSRTPSPIMEPRDNNRELIDQLKQTNTQLMARLARASRVRLVGTRHGGPPYLGSAAQSTLCQTFQGPDSAGWPVLGRGQPRTASFLGPVSTVRAAECRPGHGARPPIDRQAHWPCPAVVHHNPATATKAQ